MASICLVGAGGVGTIAALVLTKSGAHVTTVLRSTFDHVREHGWQIDSVDHGQLAAWRPHRVVGSVADAVTEAGYDYVVVCTKQLPERPPSTADLIAPLVTAGRTTVVLMQNGMGIEADVVARWPGCAVVSSVSHIGSAVQPPNRVVQVGRDVSKMGPHYHAGLADAESLRRARAFVELYRAGGAHRVDLVPGEAMQAARWEKLLWNGSFNPVCALTRADVGQLQRCRARESLLLPLMWEIWRTAAADGHPLPASVVPWMAYRLPDDCDYRPSMLLDLEAGRPLELEAILGYALRRAESLGVDVPTMRTVYELLRVVQSQLVH